MAGKTCTCGARFLDAEDFRDHMPCRGSAADVAAERATKAETENERLRAALEALRPYFGKLTAERGELGASHWQAARDAFAVLDSYTRR